MKSIILIPLLLGFLNTPNYMIHDIDYQQTDEYTSSEITCDLFGDVNGVTLYIYQVDITNTSSDAWICLQYSDFILNGDYVDMKANDNLSDMIAPNQSNTVYALAKDKCEINNIDLSIVSFVKEISPKDNITPFNIRNEGGAVVFSCVDKQLYDMRYSHHIDLFVTYTYQGKPVASECEYTFRFEENGDYSYTDIYSYANKSAITTEIKDVKFYAYTKDISFWNNLFYGVGALTLFGIISAIFSAIGVIVGIIVLVVLLVKKDKKSK